MMGFCEDDTEHSEFHKIWNFLQLNNYKIFKEDFAP
jgi:hypothetical protein